MARAPIGRCMSAQTPGQPRLRSLGSVLVVAAACWTLPAAGQHATASTVSSAPAAAAALGEVSLKDSVVALIRVPHGQKSAADRASEASSALGSAAKLPNHEVRVEAAGEALVLFAGEIPVLQLYAEDAEAAGDISLAVHAASTAAKLRQALDAEHKRGQIADFVFSASLVVFLGLVTLYVLKRSAAVERRLRASLEQHPGRVGSVKVRSFELLGPAATRVLLTLLLGAGRWSLWGASLYAYLVVVSSLFKSTRGYADQLTHFILAPGSALLGRLIASLPVLVFVLLASLLVWLLLRLSSLFFASVARGETSVEWVPRDMGETLGALSRVALVVLAVVFAAPVVTGATSGAFAEVGTHLLLALALGSAPIFASAGLGAVLTLRRHVRLGDWIRVGKSAGRIDHFGLVDLLLRTSSSERIRVPYLATLLTPVEISSEPKASVVFHIDPNAVHAEVLRVLRERAAELHESASVVLLGITPRGARYQLSVAHGSLTREQLLVSCAEALRLSGTRLLLLHPADGS